MDIEEIKEYFFSEINNEDFVGRFEKESIPIETLMTYYKCAIMEIETKLKVLNEEFSIYYDQNPIETIKSRLKSPTSILRKMKERNLPLTLNALEKNIFDIAGVRVVCSFEKDIYLLAECLLKQDDVTLVTVKDYIKNPKDNGYRSLHLIVEVPIFLRNEKRLMKVEVQLRTIAMDFWASLEHKLRYKKDFKEKIAATISKDLLDCAYLSADLDHKMELIRNQIYDNE